MLQNPSTTTAAGQQQMPQPKLVVIRRRPNQGFGFTLRHFIAYPPEDDPSWPQEASEPYQVKAMETIFIKEVHPNGPAYYANLQTGDRVLMVNNTPIAGIAYSTIVSMIKQTPSELKLLVVPKECDVLQMHYTSIAHTPQSNVTNVGNGNTANSASNNTKNSSSTSSSSSGALLPLSVAMTGKPFPLQHQQHQLISFPASQQASRSGSITSTNSLRPLTNSDYVDIATAQSYHHQQQQQHTANMLTHSDSSSYLRFGKNTSTSNYLNHLRSIHDIDVKSTNYKKTTLMTQNALDSTMSKNDKFQNARRLAEMCCIDLQPFYIIERSGFQKYVKSLSPKPHFPRAYTVSSTALNDVYNLYLNRVKDKLKNSTNHICLVLDMWTDKHKRLSYINIKVHYCQQFKLEVVTLKTEIFPRPHTALAVAEKIKVSLMEFNLSNKNICAVTDGGSNIVAALKTENISRYGCIAHALHRFLSHDVLNNKSFNHINTIISKLKDVYRSLMYSSEEITRLQNIEEQNKIMQFLEESQKILEEQDKVENFPCGDDDFCESSDKLINAKHSISLKNSVPTRWNSLLSMFTSFEQNIDAINIALLKVKRENLIIPEMEKQIIKEVLVFLKIFEKATWYLQGQKYATLSSCIYFYENIICCLEKTENESCFDLTIKLCRFAIDNFGKRFKILKIHLLAALLDPCQKNWVTLENYCKKIPINCKAECSFELKMDFIHHKTKEDLLLEQIKEINSQSESQCDFQEMPSTSRIAYEDNHNKKQKISDTRQEMLNFVTKTSTNKENSLEMEINKYFAINVDETESLEWWQQHKEIFPNIAKLAEVCFGIPATSASSEQAFSIAGTCINEKRSRLNPTTIKKQLFVHDNYKTVMLRENIINYFLFID